MGMAITIPRYTVEDLERFPDDGNRYELLDGVLLVTPFPSPAHQIVVSRIKARLFLALASSARAQIVGPGVVSLPPNTQLQPDILVYPARFAPGIDWAKITEHWLAVEVLSRSSRIYDREVKRGAYFALGVPELWLADPRERCIEVWRLNRQPEIVRDVVRWRVPTLNLVVPIDVAEVFAGIE